MTTVFSGSLGSDKRMWEPQRRDGIDGVRLEHPGHGGAPLVEVRDLADLAAAALAAIDAPRFSFVGVSLGGAVGMRIALDAPDRLERLALVCTSARFGESQGWLDRAALVREQGLETIVDMLMERWFTPEFPDVRRYREMFLATDPEGYARCCDALALWDACDEVARIVAPTLVVTGADDHAAPPAAGALLAERIPNARHAVLQNARHLASVERAADVNALLREHLA